MSLGSSVISAFNMLLNGLEKGVSPYGVSAVTYYAASAIITMLVFTYGKPPSSWKVSLLGSLDGAVVGGALADILFRFLGILPSMLLFIHFGARINLLYFPVLLLVVVLAIELSLLFVYAELVVPGSNFLLAGYNGLSTVLSGVWFAPESVGPLLPLFRVTPQYWIGEATRLAVIGKSMESPTAIIMALVGYSAVTWLITPWVRKKALRTGYL